MELKLLFEGKLRDEEVTVDLSIHRIAAQCLVLREVVVRRRHSPI